MKSSGTTDEVRRILTALDLTESWVTRYLADPSVRPTERETAYAFRRYMATARLYAVGPHPSPAELVRLRQKIAQIAVGMVLAYRKSGRR